MYLKTNYDEFRQLNEADKISQVRQYYIEKAKAKGKYEMPWWMGGTTNVNLSFYADLDIEEKREIETRALILFESLFNVSKDRQNKYKTFSLWLCTNYSLLCTNMRDLFTAGGSYHYINGQKLEHPYPHIVGDLLNSLPRIKKMLKDPDYMLMKSIEEFWDSKYDRNNLLSSWVNMIEDKFKSQAELKDIPIRELIEMEAIAQI